MVNTSSVRIAMAGALLVSCGVDNTPEETSADSVIATLSAGSTGGPEGTGGTAVGVTGDTGNGPANGAGTGPSTGDTMDTGVADSGIFDVADAGFCQTKPPGIYCTEENRASVTCGADGDIVAEQNCVPGTCLADVGCVVCEDGQFDCKGDRIMACNATGPAPHSWDEIGACDPASGERCNAATGMCEPSTPVGGIEPTGVYFQFANFNSSDSPFASGYNVDSIGDKIYTTGGGGSTIDEYSVQLLDSDGDGELEPNQHPLNEDQPGEIEERVLTLIQSIPAPASMPGAVNELYALDDRIYIGGQSLSEYVLATATTTVISMPPPWAGAFSQIGYDDVNGVWYASRESPRRVIQFNATTQTWGIMFDYPELAGSHMDGLEVVTDPVTGTPYVYVSDMTSDFIGQYRKDADLGWVQENLFSYEGTEGEPVEGMGFGALNHFWATSGSSLYELGGGDLTVFTEPPG